MPSKTQEYLKLANRTANGITRYWEHWTDFLTTASRLYKYSFTDQLTGREVQRIFYTYGTENERKNRGFLWDNLQRIGRKVSGSGLSFAGRERQILFTGRSAWLSWTGYAAKTDGSDGKGNRICDQGTQERFL